MSKLFSYKGNCIIELLIEVIIYELYMCIGLVISSLIGYLLVI